MASQQQVPATPRVISPSPTPSERSGKDGYFPPTTRSKTTGSKMSSVQPIQEDADAAQEEEDPEFQRARSRSRSPQIQRKEARQTNGGISTSAQTMTPVSKATRRQIPDGARGAGDKNGLLTPDSAYPQGFGSAYWRNLSRSPSPFGLIPIHRDWRVFIHKHEVPRKVLHVSIGFVTLYLYAAGVQTSSVHPILLGLLIPICATDLIRFRWPAFNRFYIRVLGGFMRESEAHDRYNGVISYLAGLWLTFRFCRKDVAVMSVLLLSWCDAAASTFGRLWGRFTPRVRKGKSLAGSLAAFTIGVGSAALFWGVVAPWTPWTMDEGVDSFAYQGRLTLPASAREWLALNVSQATVQGPAATTVMSVVSGVVVSVSEAFDVWSLDDNLTIPVFVGLGLGTFLWAFGG